MSSNYAPPDLQGHPNNGYSYGHQLPRIGLPPHHQAHHPAMPPLADELAHQQPHPATPTSADPQRQPAQNDGSPPQPLKIVSKVDNERGWKFTLQVVQQPQRARMCGFGDKDRRPITPPPCVRLIVTDTKTGKEVDCNEIDHAHYVISVDLWAEDGQREVNLVRHTTATPSISSTTPASYASVESSAATTNSPYPNILPSTHNPNGYQAPPSAQFGAMSQPGMAPGMAPGFGMANAYHPAASYMNPTGMPTNGYGPPQQFYPDHFAQQQAMVPSQNSMYGAPRGSYPGPAENGMARFSIGASGQPQGMFTRNLIGSLVTSACRLTDPTDKIGIWFILQDLSVRTEGSFRLRFSFVDVTPLATGPQGAGSLNPLTAPVLAACFSDVFTVFSAKKFPGVCESTPLSKCFAGQGVKIPIRKEGSGKGGDDDDY